MPQTGTLRIFEGIGGGLPALGVPERSQFEVWSALVNYILGAAALNAANARHFPPDVADRPAFLTNVAARWKQLDSAAYPFMHRLAARIEAHDDREQFMAGVDFILAGIATGG